MTLARALWVQTLVLAFAVWLGAIVLFAGFYLADGIHGTNVSTKVAPPVPHAALALRRVGLGCGCARESAGV